MTRQIPFEKTFKRALAVAGLPADFRFHDLRHSFASHALDQGVPEATVQLYMGHASAEELKGTYHHQVKGAAARDRKALETVFFTETRTLRSRMSWRWTTRRRPDAWRLAGAWRSRGDPAPTDDIAAAHSSYGDSSRRIRPPRPPPDLRQCP
ncbi:tyrosine-type recombinase/integrase [Kitasatospora sp. NPDC092286]|uniref:tyrosine-type recombinase/integrase n=1 Tax=Kitasatospora sp. NPDC092286 TaxID=3364087 RepID=UPI00380E3D90